MDNVVAEFGGGDIIICDSSPSEILCKYAGRTRFKPADYFGKKLSEISTQFCLSSDKDLEYWYNCFLAAYRYYWKDQPGRITFYETANAPRTSPCRKGLVHSLLPPPHAEANDGKGIRVGFNVPSLELYRRAISQPIFDSSFITGAEAPTRSNVHFAQLSLEDVPRELWAPLDIQARGIDGAVWLSIHEIELLSITATPQQVIYSKTAPVSLSLPKRFQASNWETLSHSVEMAHFARLAGLVSLTTRTPNNFGLSIAGAIRAIKANRIKPVIDALPVNQLITHTFTGIELALDNAYLMPVLEAAYKAQLLPTKSIDQVDVAWQRESSAFDALFECYLKGQTHQLHDWNTKALSKGGLNV